MMRRIRAGFGLVSCLLIATLSFSGVSCRADDKDDAKKEISTQLALLLAGKVGDLKAHFTERQKERVTPEAVAKGTEKTAKLTIDELVESVETGEYEGAKTLKIKMKNGRTLTTLVLVDGKWLADTIWFK